MAPKGKHKRSSELRAASRALARAADALDDYEITVLPLAYGQPYRCEMAALAEIEYAEDLISDAIRTFT